MKGIVLMTLLILFFFAPHVIGDRIAHVAYYYNQTMIDLHLQDNFEVGDEK